MSLKEIVENNDTTAAKAFDLFIQFLIVLSLVSFSIETIPGLTNKTLRILNATEVITVSIFTIEYFLRLFVANKKLKFVFSFYGLIDLLAVLPFYIALGIDLRSIRIFRLFRLIRVFKIFRYGKASRRFSTAFIKIREELILFLIATTFMLFLAAVGIYYFENTAQPEQFKSVFHCLWWAVTTLATVGYGDVYPITVGGKIFTSFVVFIGLGVVAVPAGLLAAALTSAAKDEECK